MGLKIIGKFNIILNNRISLTLWGKSLEPMDITKSWVPSCPPLLHLPSVCLLVCGSFYPPCCTVGVRSDDVLGPGTMSYFFALRRSSAFAECFGSLLSCSVKHDQFYRKYIHCRWLFFNFLRILIWPSFLLYRLCKSTAVLEFFWLVWMLWRGSRSPRKEFCHHPL